MRPRKIAPLESVEDALYGERTTVTVSIIASTSEGEVLSVKATRPGCDFVPEEQFLASLCKVSFYIATRELPRLYLTETGKLSPLKHRRRDFENIEQAWEQLGSLKKPEDFEIIKRKAK